MVSRDNGFSWKCVLNDESGGPQPIIHGVAYYVEQIQKDPTIVPTKETLEQSKLLRNFKPGTEPQLEKMLINRNRDPKIIWHEGLQKYVCVLYLGSHGCFGIFNSTDLTNWEWVNTVRFPGKIMECPGIFPAPVYNLDGTILPGKEKWVFAVSYNYYIGDFDGITFTPEDFYKTKPRSYIQGGATGPLQFFSNTKDKRNICMVILWNGRFPRANIEHQFSLPMTATLYKAFDNSTKMHFLPSKEIEDLRISSLFKENDIKLTKDKAIDLSSVWADTMDFEAEFELDDEDEVLIQIKNTKIRLNRKQLNNVDIHPIGKKVSLRIVIDVNSIEIYANKGEAIICSHLFEGSRLGPSELKTLFPRRILNNHHFSMSTSGNPVKAKCQLWKLRAMKTKDISTARRPADIKYSLP